MPEGPSLTAELVALVRAREQALEPARRIVDDPYAARFLELLGSLLIRGGGLHGPLAVGTNAAFKLPWVGFAPLVLARHRAMDELLLDETKAGARQCVVLGAGYDARAYRFPPPLGPARFFEVDHPTLSSRKRDLVTKVFGKPPSHTTFVAVDFLSERIADRLLEEGYDPAARTVFIWEGVVYYLTRDAVRATLEQIRALAAPRSSIVFDAWAKGRGLRGMLGAAGRSVSRVFGRIVGEPFLFSFESREGAKELLRETGYELIFDRGAEQLRAAFKERGRHLLFLPPFIVVAAGRVP